jgi:uncharacterized membrane protein
MLPDWAPNLHPLVVHFPIALLFAGFAVDVASLAIRRLEFGLRAAAVALYASGALGTAVAYLTGNQAADTVTIPTEAIAAVNDHQDLALYTLIFFGIYAVGRVALLATVRSPRLVVRGPVALVALFGLFLLWETSSRGGRLVYEYGLGVAAVEVMAGELQALREAEFDMRVADASPVVGEGGSWVWRIVPGAVEVFEEAFNFVEGSPGDVHVMVHEEEDGAFLVMHPIRSPITFVAGEPLASLDMEVVLDASDFAGTVSLVHNVRDAENFHFLRFGERIVQGRVTNGLDQELAAGERRAEGWTTLRATGDRGHFYSYEDGRTVAHGHSATPEAGLTGLRIDGTGELRLRRIEVRAVR